MSEIEILKQFKNGLIAFIDELINQFPQEGDLVLVRIFLKDRYPIIDIMNNFVLKILPLKDMIKERNENFFLNNCQILNVFNDKNKDKINRFRKLWRSPSLDKEDKRVVWEWFDSFIYLSEKYQKCKSNV